MLRAVSCVLALLVAAILVTGCATHRNELNAVVCEEPAAASTLGLPAIDQEAMLWSPGPAPAPLPPQAILAGEEYEGVEESGFFPVQHKPLSTFSIDVDTASYAVVRRCLEDGYLPPAEAVRVEELVNYFDYDYPSPEGEMPFCVTAEIAGCPWNGAHRLARVGLKAESIANEARPPANLVFLIDVSGSMSAWNKLPLVKQGLRMLVSQLRKDDRVAIVVYAGQSGIALESTACTVAKKREILHTIESLGAGGSTHGSAGIEAAYETAAKGFLKRGVNRVILATDGDFNVGATGRGQLESLIQEKAESGVFLTVLGFGMGNLKDARLETLADKGNGHYAYIDSAGEARKVFVEEIAGTLVTVAKDVKIQVEFNPLRAAGYRLIGYENRLLADEDFNDDTKDAGEMGAGHTVTALYEVVPPGEAIPGVAIDELRYQKTEPTSAAAGNELFTVKVRYKEPSGDESKLLMSPIVDGMADFGEASADLRFAASVAAFGQRLRNSLYVEDISYDDIIEMAQGSRGLDEAGYRAEFVGLVKDAKALDDVKQDDKRKDKEEWGTKPGALGIGSGRVDMGGHGRGRG